MEDNHCPLCGKQCETQRESGNYTVVRCGDCGVFYINWNIFTHSSRNTDYERSKLDSSCDVLKPQVINKRCSLIYEFLLRKPYYPINGLECRYKFFYDENSVGQTNLDPTSINIAEYIKSYPKNLNEKINRILLNLAVKYPNIGDEFNCGNLNFCLLFVESERLDVGNNTTNNEKNTLIEFLSNSNYITRTTKKNGSAEEVFFKLSEKAWEKIAALEQENTENTNVFVAMSFHESTKPTREAIRRAIVNAGFLATFMDEEIHNRQIVPEMLRLIKESRFLIMDISDPNYGAYYEAGFAMGLGKEVVITCSKDVFDKKTYEDWIEEKAKKPHFDIAQKQILVWQNEADLTKKLQEWIKYLFLKG